MFIKNRTYTKYIVLVSTMTDAKTDIGFKELDRQHRDKGSVMCNFHYIVRRDGMIETGRELDKLGNHIRSMNKSSVYVCLIGSEENLTQKQHDSLDEIVKELEDLYPDAQVVNKL